jgi:hypothetical protein
VHEDWSFYLFRMNLIFIYSLEVRFVLDRAVGYVLAVIQFSLSVSFNHCCTFIFVSKPLLSEEHVTESWEPSYQAALYRNWEH